MDPLTILAVLGPLLVEGGKAAIARWLAPDEFKPSTIEQFISVRRLDLELFKSMNEAGGTNPGYPWVDAIVRLQRPFAVAIVIGAYGAMALTGKPIPDTVANFASAVGFYLFGDRTLFYARRAVKP